MYHFLISMICRSDIANLKTDIGDIVGIKGEVFKTHKEEISDKYGIIKQLEDKQNFLEMNIEFQEKKVDEKLEKYDITNAAYDIENFTDELSNWYVRRNRERFWAQELNDEKIGAYLTLYKGILINRIKTL